MSIVVASNTVDGDEITIAAHGDVATDVWEGIRNPDTTVIANIKVRYRKTQNDHTINNLQPGDTFPAEIDRIYETGTSATTVEVYKLN